jgi:hypothetical protein
VAFQIGYTIEPFGLLPTYVLSEVQRASRFLCCTYACVVWCDGREDSCLERLCNKHGSTLSRPLRWSSEFRTVCPPSPVPDTSVPSLIGTSATANKRWPLVTRMSWRVASVLAFTRRAQCTRDEAM